MTAPEPVGRFEWERVVKRCRIPRATKYVALTLATFASPNGADVRPGEHKLAADLGMSERNARRHIARLRDTYALVARTRFHGSRAGYVDEYRLVIPADLERRVAFTDDPELTHQRPCVSGGSRLEPVDNPSPAAPAAENHRTTSAESPDSWRQNHRTCASAHHPGTTHRPDKAPVGPYGNVEGSSALAAKPRPDPAPPDRYAAAVAVLQRLPDLGGGYMRRARDALGDGAPLRDQVIHAAALAREPP